MRDGCSKQFLLTKVRWPVNTESDLGTILIPFTGKNNSSNIAALWCIQKCPKNRSYLSMISWNQEMGHFYSQAEFLSTLGLFVPGCKWDHTRKIFRMYDLVLENIKVKESQTLHRYNESFYECTCKRFTKRKKIDLFPRFMFCANGGFFGIVWGYSKKIDTV